MDVLEVIKSRRTIRAYKTIPVGQDVLDTVLEAGSLAPSWGNTQTWRWIVVHDQNIKTEIAENVIRKGNQGANAVKTAPVVIVACAELNKSGFREGQPATDKGGYWYMFDAGLALENMVLVAGSLGLGTIFLGGMHSEKLEALLEVPEGYACVIMMALGYPAEEPGARPRKAIDELVFRNKFGAR